MERGRSNKLVGATGEYLVAAELCRRGLIATTFTGNVPHYDIIASDEQGRHAAVQVKTSRSETWQMGSVDMLFEVDLHEDSQTQTFGDLKPAPVRRLVFVYVALADDGNDRFFILRWRTLAALVRRNHQRYLDRHNGTRPKRWDSLHVAVTAKQLKRHEGRWDVIENALR